MFGGFMASGVSNGPGSQMSSRMLAIFQLAHAKGIAGSVGSDSSACEGIRTHSLAGDPLSRKATGTTCLAVCVDPAPLALRTSQAEETQAK